MGPSAGEIEQQIADTRGEMQSKIVQLREQSRRTVQRSKRALLIAIGAGVAIGTLVGIGYLAYRMTRPATLDERISRVLPRDWWKSARAWKDRTELRLREGVPAVRLYVGDRQIGEEAPETSAQKMLVLFARTAGTAAATALASRFLGRLTNKEAA